MRKTAVLLSLTLALLLSSLALLTPSPAGAQQYHREVIEKYESRVDVFPDGSMTVTETITVVALGQQIKRGIYRDFPTLYQDPDGTMVRVPFDVVGVLRDGKPEPWRTESRANGVRLYLGDADVFLDHGRHVYQITYKTDHQIGFFEDHDELYWNVTGNDWAFPILEATAVVALPQGAEVYERDGWTGVQGAGDGAPGAKDLNHKSQGGNSVFTTTRALQPSEGLTIVVSFSKGVVAEPTAVDQALRKAGSYSNLIWALGALGLALAWYLWAWGRVGRDPSGGPIVPLFYPPEGVSPGAARYIMRMGYDNKVFAASVLSCAVKGGLVIEEPRKRRYELLKGRDLAEIPDLAREESKLLGRLFSHRERVELKQKNRLTLVDAVDGLKKSLSDRYKGSHFARNFKWTLPGLAITLAGLAALALLGPRPEDDKVASAALAVFAVVWGGFVSVMWVELFKGRSNGKSVFSILFLLMVTGIMTMIWLGQVLFLWSFVGSKGMLLVLGFAGLNGLFVHLLRAPTVIGRRIMDQLEGFRMYLGVAEKDRLEFFHPEDGEPPEETPELFERYLPYAMALDVEHTWSKRFSGILEQAMADPQSGYHPYWYSGVHGMSGLTGLSSGFAADLGGSLSGAIASASTSPGSSSGSGGGGFSGGGGGGGGGGGW